MVHIYTYTDVFPLTHVFVSDKLHILLCDDFPEYSETFHICYDYERFRWSRTVEFPYKLNKNISVKNHTDIHININIIKRVFSNIQLNLLKEL